MERFNKDLEGKKCDLCEGNGSIITEGDLHRSGGVEPCPRGYFNGHGFPYCRNGKLHFSDYDLKNWDNLKENYT